MTFTGSSEQLLKLEPWQSCISQSLLLAGLKMFCSVLVASSCLHAHLFADERDGRAHVEIRESLCLPLNMNSALISPHLLPTNMPSLHFLAGSAAEEGAAFQGRPRAATSPPANGAPGCIGRH